MKELYLALSMIYGMASMLILGMGVLFPFGINLNGAPPVWTAFILYPVVIFVAVTQERVLDWFDKKLNQ